MSTSFIIAIKAELLSVSSRRGINRKKKIEMVCETIKNKLLKQENTILELHNQLLLHQSETTVVLKKRIDDQVAKLQDLEKENNALQTFKMKAEAFFLKQNEELTDLRKKCGVVLPSFLDDTELT